MVSTNGSSALGVLAVGASLAVAGPGAGLAGGAASAGPARLPRARNSPQAAKRLWDDLIDFFSSSFWAPSAGDYTRPRALTPPTPSLPALHPPGRGERGLQDRSPAVLPPLPGRVGGGPGEEGRGGEGPYFGGGATSAWAVRIFPLSGSKIASVRWCGILRSFSRVS